MDIAMGSNLEGIEDCVSARILQARVPDTAKLLTSLHYRQAICIDNNLGPLFGNCTKTSSIRHRSAREQERVENACMGVDVAED